MEHGRQVGIVEVEAVRKDSVHKGRLRRRVAPPGTADDAGLVSSPGVRDQLNGPIGKAGRSGGERDPDRVEYAQAGAGRDIPRKPIEVAGFGEGRKLLQQGATTWGGCHLPATTAIGRTGDPVAPTNRSGRHTKRNS